MGSTIFARRTMHASQTFAADPRRRMIETSRACCRRRCIQRRRSRTYSPISLSCTQRRVTSAGSTIARGGCLEGSCRTNHSSHRCTMPWIFSVAAAPISRRRAVQVPRGAASARAEQSVSHISREQVPRAVSSMSAWSLSVRSVSDVASVSARRTASSTASASLGGGARGSATCASASSRRRRSSRAAKEAASWLSRMAPGWMKSSSSASWRPVRASMHSESRARIEDISAMCARARCDSTARELSTRI